MIPAPPRGESRLVPWLLGALAGSLVAGRYETALGCLAVGAVGAALAGARPPARAWLMASLVSIAVGLVLNAYLNPGRPIGPPLGGRFPTAEGLAHGGLLALRMIGALVAVQGLRAAWPGERAADAVAAALAPLRRFGVPVGDARLLLGLGLRFAPAMAHESERIARIQELRAGRPAKGWRERWERRRAAAVPALVSALERADRVALALEARHYRLRPAGAGPRAAGGGSWLGRAGGAAIAGSALLWRS